MLTFLLPAVFYFNAEKKCATEYQKLENTQTRQQAWLFVFLGLISFTA
jgi:hypothetical protein